MRNHQLCLCKQLYRENFGSASSLIAETWLYSSVPDDVSICKSHSADLVRLCGVQTANNCHESPEIHLATVRVPQLTSNRSNAIAPWVVKRILLKLKRRALCLFVGDTLSGLNREKMSLTQRSHSENYWASSGLSGSQNGNTSNGIGSKLDGFLDKRELPMYKDKPYSYPSRRSTPLYQRWRVISGAILGLVALAYLFGLFSPSLEKPTPRGTSKSAWNWLSKPSASVDWEDRREKVKEAFMLSWDGYERYAWGRSAPAPLIISHLNFMGSLMQPLRPALIRDCHRPRRLSS